MDREILFRGKTEYGEWVEGNLVHQTKYYGDPVDRYHILDEGEFDCDFYSSELVIPETIGQFTGLTDKNGTRIFEGDIIQTKRKGYKGEKTYRFVVKYGEYIPKDYCREEYSEYNTIGFYCDNNTGHYQLGAYSNVVEVIGNVHDNPELIGEREDNEP